MLKFNRRFVFYISLVVLLLIGILSLLSGSVHVSIGQLIDSFSFTNESRLSYIVSEIRLPRFLFACIAGISLAISGTALQGMFRNPLTDPSIIGISSGAAFFASLVIIFSDLFPAELTDQFGNFFLAFFAFIGGLITTIVVYKVSSFGHKSSIMMLLLTGLGVNTFFFGAIGLMTYIADEQQLKQLSFWNLGSLGSASWETFFIAFPLVLLSSIGVILLAKQLNTLSLGELNASALGVDVKRLSRWIIILSALSVGIITAFCGIISFVGIIVPHLARMVFGPNHNYLAYASIIFGAIFLSLTDLASRTLFIPSELPINIITSFIGAPIFLYVLLRQKQQGFV
ncbi:MAG: iron ABC transporter permease [Calditrichaeota bacterium]|nr:iron ABC transporter permease [Calditrichota bacterium]